MNKFLKEEIETELKIRGSDTGTVAEMRSILRSCLCYENEGHSLQLKKYPFLFDEDQVAIAEKLVEITDLIDTFHGIPNFGIHTKITTKLAHIGGRIDKMQVDSEDEFDIQAKFKKKTVKAGRNAYFQAKSCPKISTQGTT